MWAKRRAYGFRLNCAPGFQNSLKRVGGNAAARIRVQFFHRFAESGAGLFRRGAGRQAKDMERAVAGHGERCLVIYGDRAVKDRFFLRGPPLVSRSDLIPPSPDDEEYARAVQENGADPEESEDPYAVFGDWLALAREREPNDANAMALATADADGMPDVRMVLLKDFSAEGFVFYTNTDSAKGRQLKENPAAALCFHWKSLRRQVRVRGPVSAVTEAEADEYFSSRARDARIGAWASKQSAALNSREELEAAVAQTAAEFSGTDVPRPAFWNGFRLAPLEIEFWRDRPFRLHDRIAFRRQAPDQGWGRQRLYP